jgi:hypothetical protein
MYEYYQNETGNESASNKLSYDFRRLIVDSIVADTPIAENELELLYNKVVPIDLRERLKLILSADRYDSLEPFHLSEKSRRISEIFVGVCLMSGAKRCRIGSDLSASCEGGLVITSQLNAFQVFRSSFRRPRTDKSTCYLSCNQANAIREQILFNSDQNHKYLDNMNSSYGDESSQFTVTIKSRQFRNWDFIRASLTATGFSTYNHNWNIRCKANAVTITSGSPEGLIKLLTACSRSESLDLHFEQDIYPGDRSYSRKTRKKIVTVLLQPPGFSSQCYDLLSVKLSHLPFDNFIRIRDFDLEYNFSDNLKQLFENSYVSLLSRK